MKNVTPKVYLLATSSMQLGDTEQWLKDLGVSDAACHRIVDSNKTDAERIVEVAGRRCYKSFEPGMNPNVTKIREDIVDYIDNILKVGHGSVIEHVTFSFAIENVSRVFTGEMNRHRAGMAISEGSMRYIRYEDIPYWVPTSIKLTPDEKIDETTERLRDAMTSISFQRQCIERACFDSLLADRPETKAVRDGLETLLGQLSKELQERETEIGLPQKKWHSQSLFQIAFGMAEWIYAELSHTWKDELSPESKFKAKKEITSMMRRIIPMGVATGGIWTGNLRALRHVCEMRCSSAAEEEILFVATQMLEILKQTEPSFFRDFTTDENGYSAPKHKKV